MINWGARWWIEDMVTKYEISRKGFLSFFFFSFFFNISKERMSTQILAKYVFFSFLFWTLRLCKAFFGITSQPWIMLKIILLQLSLLPAPFPLPVPHSIALFSQQNSQTLTFTPSYGILIFKDTGLFQSKLWLNTLPSSALAQMQIHTSCWQRMSRATSFTT